jgi:2'-5' RNA ligase
LIVPVPEATEAVAPWREKLDPSASWGIPPHITILYPFVRPNQVTQEVVIDLSGVFAEFQAFDFQLSRIGWFGAEVLYLAPDPAAPFLEITDTVLGRHPEYPPYGGEHAEVVPHLTVGHREHGALDEASRAIAPVLPIHARATEVWLLGTQRGIGWQMLGRFQLPNSAT